jgi:uncharacterized RDD family membrane protein YckC
MSAADAFGRRLGARVIDALLVFVVVCIVVGLFILIAAALSRSAIAGLVTVGAVIGIYFFPFPLLVATGLYHGLMESRRGQTLGKMAVGIRIMTSEARNPSFGQAFLRATAGTMASNLVCLLGYFWMLWDPLQQTWGDKIASTYIRRA